MNTRSGRRYGEDSEPDVKLLDEEQDLSSSDDSSADTSDDSSDDEPDERCSRYYDNGYEDGEDYAYRKGYERAWYSAKTYGYQNGFSLGFQKGLDRAPCPATVSFVNPPQQAVTTPNTKTSTSDNPLQQAVTTPNTKTSTSVNMEGVTSNIKKAIDNIHYYDVKSYLFWICLGLACFVGSVSFMSFVLLAISYSVIVGTYRITMDYLPVWILGGGICYMVHQYGIVSNVF